MQNYSGFEYLLIDIANQWGKDKELFQDRIDWVLENMEDLELIGSLRDFWKEKPLYVKAVMALRNAQSGVSTGHLVGFDSTCSGLQIMSALTGCHAGAGATNLVDPDYRADAYTECLEIMRRFVPSLPDEDRSKVKQAVMTSLYGSKAEPMKLFGEGTPELDAFYKSLMILSPGSCTLLQVLLDSWQPYELTHSWVLPDNHHVHVDVTQKFTKRLEIDELAHTTFTYKYQDNVGTASGLSNAANVIHSIDAYVLRSVIRRCNYNKDIIDYVATTIQEELLFRNTSKVPTKLDCSDPELQALINRYRDTKMLDVSITPYLDHHGVQYLTTDHLRKLSILLNNMLEHPSFEVVTIHDEFKCGANHMNQLRYHYKEIMAELADSTILSDIMSSLYRRPMTYAKLSNNLSSSIRNSNYALC